MAMPSIDNVFVHDLQKTGQTALASATTGGLLSDGTSGGLIFSPDSQSLFFTSTALDLTSNPPDTSNGPLATDGSPPDNLFGAGKLASRDDVARLGDDRRAALGHVGHVRGPSRPTARRSISTANRGQPDRRRSPARSARTSSRRPPPSRRRRARSRRLLLVSTTNNPPSTASSTAAPAKTSPTPTPTPTVTTPAPVADPRADRLERRGREGPARRRRAGHHLQPGARSGHGPEHRQLPGEPPWPHGAARGWSSDRPPARADRSRSPRRPTTRRLTRSPWLFARACIHKRRHSSRSTGTSGGVREHGWRSAGQARTRRSPGHDYLATLDLAARRV